MWRWRRDLNPNRGAGRNLEMRSDLLVGIVWHTLRLPCFVPKCARNVPAYRCGVRVVTTAVRSGRV